MATDAEAWKRCSSAMRRRACRPPERSSNGNWRPTASGSQRHDALRDRDAVEHRTGVRRESTFTTRTAWRRSPGQFSVAGGCAAHHSRHHRQHHGAHLLTVLFGDLRGTSCRAAALHLIDRRREVRRTLNFAHVAQVFRVRRERTDLNTGVASSTPTASPHWPPPADAAATAGLESRPPIESKNHHRRDKTLAKTYGADRATCVLAWTAVGQRRAGCACLQYSSAAGK